MQLVLDRITHRVGAHTHLHPLDLALQPGALTVLLGATRAGKTTLLRLMAGLDAPSGGRVLVDGVDVTGRPVRERNIAMVYQQFINYPSLTVAENIAAPLRRQRAQGRVPGRVQGADSRDIDERVRALARRLRIDPFLGRLPAELSGGQQQRVALARALVKRAPLVLLDEPLVNLDYKLREELRDELAQLFATGESTVVYATTDPTEALLLGGYTAILDRGSLLQYGPTADVFHAPTSLRVAQAFSDPPMNLVAGVLAEGGVRVATGEHWPVTGPPVASRSGAPCTVGIRAGALRMTRRSGDAVIPGDVLLADIAGSDTYLHVRSAHGVLVAQLPGVHQLGSGTPVQLCFDPAQLFLFAADGSGSNSGAANGSLLRAPARRLT
jgi:glycerol transport system ATP-binding protein